jgi:hypothetical protein
MFVAEKDLFPCAAVILDYNSARDERAWRDSRRSCLQAIYRENLLRACLGKVAED